MTNPSRADRYPVEYFDVLEIIEERPTAKIKMECETKGKAYGLRSRIYAFQRAVEKDPRYSEYHNAAASLTILFEPPSSLLLVHRDHSPSAIQMREALKNFEQGNQDEK